MAVLLCTGKVLIDCCVTFHDPLDLILALTVGLDETIPYELFQRSSFWNARRILLLQWIIMANILSHAYKGTLLSTLVTYRYAY